MTIEESRKHVVDEYLTSTMTIPAMMCVVIVAKTANTRLPAIVREIAWLRDMHVTHKDDIDDLEDLDDLDGDIGKD